MSPLRPILRRAVTVVLAVLCVLALSTAGERAVLGAPADPARYGGTVLYYGEPALVGMIVSAHAGGDLVATTTVFVDEEGDHVYDVLVPADDPETPEKEGVPDGAVVQFRVNGVPADQTEVFDAGEVRTINLSVTKIEICVGAFHDLDADGAWDPGEPLLAGVQINLLQFFLVRQYSTTGSNEPSCAVHDAMDTVVRAVDAPAEYELTNPSAMAFVINQDQGVFVVMFAYRSVLMPTGTVSPTTTPATPTPTPGSYAGPTGMTPIPTLTPTASLTPSPTATHSATASPTATATATMGPSPTASATIDQSPTPTPTEGPSATPTLDPANSPTSAPTDTPTATPTETSTPTPTTDPNFMSEIIVNDPADPGTVGDEGLTLREAILLSTGRLSVDDLSAAERAQVSNAPGPESSDKIYFDPLIFPLNSPTLIEIQPPVAKPGPSPTPLPPGEMLPGVPNPGLPPLDTGGDMIDATDRGVILVAGLGSDMFDGLLITSSNNAIRGLEMRHFDTAITVAEGLGNVIGGDMPGQGNILVDNIAGVVMRGPEVARTFVLGNHIGIERDGETAAGNATFGVLVLNRASANQIGAAGSGNLIGANFLNGIAILGEGTSDNVVQGNRVGTNSTGARALGNGIGLVIGGGARGTIVGGIGFGANTFAGNIGEGVWLQGVGTRFSLVQGNTIGLTMDRSGPLPNGSAGLLLSDGASDNFIGGTDGRAANWISYNQGAGVSLRGATTSGNSIRRNRITANMGKGIALLSGANGGIQTPQITELDAGLFLIAGIAPPNSSIDIYSDPDDEGAHFETTTRADASGNFRVARAFDGPRLSVTATDERGNTSEFGQLAGAPTPLPRTATPTLGTPGGPDATPTAVSTLDPGTVADRLYLPYISKEAVLFARVTIVPALSRLPMGGMATFEIRASDVMNLFGMELVLRFDPARLQIIDADPAAPGVQIEPGDFPEPGRRFIAENTVDEAAGRIVYAFTLIEGDAAGGSGVVARFTIRARGPGRSHISFEEAMLLDPVARPMPVGWRGATVIVDEPPTGVPATATSVPPTATNTSTPVPPTVTPLPTATRAPTDTPSPTETPAPTLTPTVTTTPRPTNTPLPGETPPTATATVEPTNTLEPSETPVPSATSQPSATPLPSETPEPTATLRPGETPPPTPDGCTRPLINGGFENDQGWTFRGSVPPRYTSAMGYSGLRSVVLGVLSDEPNLFSYSSLWQPVRVPADAETMTVSAWTFQEAQPGGGADRQLLLVYDVDPATNADGRRAPIARIFGERTDAKAWQRRVRTFDVTAHRNQALWVYSTVVNDGLGGRAWMFLDDVSVAFCR